MRDLVWVVFGVSLAYLTFLMVYPFADVLAYGVFVYYISRPLYRRLVGYVKSEAASAFISLFILLLPITLIFLYGIGVGSMELLNLIRSSDVPYREMVGSFISRYSTVLAGISPADVLGMLDDGRDYQGMWNLAVFLLFSAMGVILRVLLMFTIAFYMLIDGKRLRAWLLDSMRHGDSKLAERFFNEVDEDLHRVFSGNILTAFFIALMGFAVFTLLNTVAPCDLRIPYTLLLGMLCGVSSLVPVVGVALFWAPAALVMAAYANVNGTLIREYWFILLFTASTAVFVDWGPNLILKPRLTGRRIHSGLMLLAYLFGPIAFGLPGLFLGPIILVLSANYAKIILPEMRK